MNERPEWYQLFKNMILDLSKRSTCIRKQVGAILVKDNRIISMGYNGVPKGHEHCYDHFKLKFESSKYSSLSDYIDSEDFRIEHAQYSDREELHAEQNMLTFCAKNGITTKDAEAYVTLSPCIHCAKMLYASGISKVYYIEAYDRDMSGIDFLIENGIDCMQI